MPQRPQQPSARGAARLQQHAAYHIVQAGVSVLYQRNPYGKPSSSLMWYCSAQGTGSVTGILELKAFSRV